MAVELSELTSLVLMSMGVIIYVISMIQQRPLVKYFPGVLSIWFVFLFTNVEGLPDLPGDLADLFNLFEHTFVLITGVCFTLGLVYEFFSGESGSFLKIVKMGEA